MKTAYESYRAELTAIREAGTYKDERIITTPQKSRIDTTAASGVVNMCANNYLGLSDHPRLIAAAGPDDYIGLDCYCGSWGDGGPDDYVREIETLYAQGNQTPIILMEFGFPSTGGIVEDDRAIRHSRAREGGYRRLTMPGAKPRAVNARPRPASPSGRARARSSRARARSRP